MDDCHLLSVLLRDFFVKQLLWVLFFALFFCWLVIQIGCLWMKINMWVLIEFLAQIVFKWGESVNFVILIPRIAIPLRVKVWVCVPLFYPHPALEVVVCQCVLAKFFERAEFLKALSELVHPFFRDALSALHSLVVSHHCVSPLINIVLLFGADNSIYHIVLLSYAPTARYTHRVLLSDLLKTMKSVIRLHDQLHRIEIVERCAQGTRA